MKQKLNQPAQLFLAIILLFSVVNCSKDSFEEIQNLESSQELLKSNAPFQVDYLSADQAPFFIKELLPSRNDNHSITSTNNYTDTETGAVFDEKSIMRVTDTMGFTNYTIRFRFPHTPERIFYNLIVGRDAQGAMNEPYIIRYVTDSEAFESFKASQYNFNYFRGKVTLHKYHDFFGNDNRLLLDLVKTSRANSHRSTTESLRTACDPGFDEFGDPLPCQTLPLSGGTTDNTGGSGNGSGSSLPAGGTAGDNQGVDLNPPSDGSSSEGSGSEGTREPQEPIDPVGGGVTEVSVGSTLEGSVIVGFVYIINTNTSGSCSQTTVTTIAILENGSKIETSRTSGVDCVNFDETGTFKTSTNTFGDCPECVTVIDGGIGVLTPLDDSTTLEEDLILASSEDLSFLESLLNTPPLWKFDPGILLNRPSLSYSHTAIVSGGKMYKLNNGLIIFETGSPKIINDEFKSNLKFNAETSINDRFYYANNPLEGNTVWYEYKIPPPLFASSDLDFLFTGFWDASKILGRYVLPLEDAIILIDGKDLDGVDASRGLAAGMLVVSVVPGGKLLKPLSKFLKNGIITLSIVKTVGGKMVAQAVGEAVNVEIRAIQREGFIFYKNVFGEEVARIADNVLVVTRHKLLPKAGSVFFREASEVNNIIKAQSSNTKFFQPPFKEVVTEFITEAPEQFVRIHGENKFSSWVMKSTDLKGLTVQQIRDKFAIDLTNPMTSVSFVNVPAGTKLYAGKANALFTFSGDGFQFYIDRAQFNTGRVDESWFSESIPIENFLNN